MPADLPSDLAEPLIGTILAERYRIDSRLGDGAMGTVYKATHVRLGRAFAVKVLKRDLTSDIKMAQRFEREADLLARTKHANVIGVIDAGVTHDGRRFMVMDLALGPTLAGVMAERPMASARIVAIVRQLLEGLHHAHEAGLVHRDFKPENVIVETDDLGREVPRIVDFGIAILRDGDESTAGATGRLTTAGLVLGTPQYMAPEQACADPIDHRVDLFAMGVIVYQMLCGRGPFDGSGVEVARANLLSDPPPIAERVPGLVTDRRLEAFAFILMAKNRNDRPATARAARDLDTIEPDLETAATVHGLPLPQRESGGGVVVSRLAIEDTAPAVIATTDQLRRGLPWWSYLLGAALLVGVVLVVWVVSSRADEPQRAAQPHETPREEPSTPVERNAPGGSGNESVRRPSGTAPSGIAHRPPPRQDDARPPETSVSAPITAAGSDAGSDSPGTGSALPTIKSPERVRPAPRPPITAANLRERYAAVQRMLKQHGTNDMWQQLQRIDLNTAIVFPEKLREASEILASLERQLDAASR